MTERSAAGPITVVSTALLSAKSGSYWRDQSVTALVIVPSRVGVTTRETVAPPPLARLPRSQVRRPPDSLQLPWLEVAEPKATCSGSASTRVTPVAEAGPLLVTVTV